MPKQHEAGELEVKVVSGEVFEWIVTGAASCKIKILDDNPLNKKTYRVIKGSPKQATVIGSKGEYDYKCTFYGTKTKTKNKKKTTNPKIIIS